MGVLTGFLLLALAYVGVSAFLMLMALVYCWWSDRIRNTGGIVYTGQRKRDR
jgi:hypothetical protein